MEYSHSFSQQQMEYSLLLLLFFFYKKPFLLTSIYAIAALYSFYHLAFSLIFSDNDGPSLFFSSPQFPPPPRTAMSSFLCRLHHLFFFFFFSLSIHTVKIAYAQEEGFLRTALISSPSSSTFKIALFADLHYGENAWTDWGPLQDIKSHQVMSLVLDGEKPGSTSRIPSPSHLMPIMRAPQF